MRKRCAWCEITLTRPRRWFRRLCRICSPRYHGDASPSFTYGSRRGQVDRRRFRRG